MGSDLAIARLAAAAPAAASIYSIYRGDGEYGIPFAKVGAGWFGVGDTGATGFDGRRRVVANSYDLNQETVYDGDFGAPTDSVLLYDFDDGSEAHDTFGKYFGVGDRGIFVGGELREGLTAQYDSGGPAFIGGVIAGVTSYVDGPAGFEGGCGPDFSDSHPASTDPGTCFDQSFGEWAADTRVSRFQDFVDAGLSGSLAFVNPVPEPSVWGMMIAGLGVAGAALRVRRSRKQTHHPPDVGFLGLVDSLTSAITLCPAMSGPSPRIARPSLYRFAEPPEQCPAITCAGSGRRPAFPAEDRAYRASLTNGN